MKYTYCNVRFENFGKEYCYLADGEDLHEGDWVIVPAEFQNDKGMSETYIDDTMKMMTMQAEWMMRRMIGTSMGRTGRTLVLCQSKAVQQFWQWRGYAGILHW